MVHDDASHVPPLADLSMSEERLGLVGALRILARGLAILGTTLLVYAFLPIRESSATAIAVTAGLGLVAVLAIFFRQFSRIEHSRRPGVAAVEALFLVGGVFLTLFAFIYVSMSAWEPGSFTQELDKVAGIYFSVTVMTTVGFGDITAITGSARILVTIQMVLDVVLIGSAVKLLAQHARSVRARRHHGPVEPPRPSRPSRPSEP